MSEIISVIIPIYNCENYLIECLDSVIEQTYDNLEIVLVDDGSIDNSGQIIDMYANKFMGLCYCSEKDKTRIIKTLHKKNEGACYARRDGLMIASSEYVMFVDGDDWIEPEMVTNLYGKAKKYDADIVTSGFIEGNEKCFDAIEKGFYYDSKIDYLRENVIYNKETHGIGALMSVCGRVMRKSLLLATMMKLPEEIRLWEDLTYCYVPYYNAKRVVITNEVYYHYRINLSSTSRKRDENEFEKMVYSFSVAHEVYSSYGVHVCGKIDILVTILLNNYVWKVLSSENGIERKKKLTKMSLDKRFIALVSTSIGQVNGTWNRRILKSLVNQKIIMAIYIYYEYQMISRIYSSKPYKIFQGTLLYLGLRKLWRLTRRGKRE